MGLSVVVAGRDLERAQAAANTLGGSAARLDRSRVTAADLRGLNVAVVVDAAGPFQGAEPTVARAAVEAGLHYVDLADARDFVAGFAVLDGEARTAGVTLLTGASSTPALSHAVLDHLTHGWLRIDHVEAAISPGARAPRGRAVMEAILTWLGRPVQVFSDGGWRARRGWGGLYRREMGTAGRRWLSLCETPDLDLMPGRFRPTQSALFLAGLEPLLLHLGAWLLGGLSAASGISLRSAAPVLTVLAKPFGLAGDDRGAMRVEARGLDADGRPVRAVWRRTIGRHRFRSVLSERRAGVSERFGLLTFDLRLIASSDRLTYEVAGWRLGLLPLPGWLAPETHTHEAVDEAGRFTFDVEIRAPLAGRLVRYRGWLVPA